MNILIVAATYIILLMVATLIIGYINFRFMEWLENNNHSVLWEIPFICIQAYIAVITLFYFNGELM